MHDIFGRIPDLRGESMEDLLARSQPGGTGLDRALSTNSASNTFNNYIFTNSESDIG
jgi:hypothetical protein